MRRNDVRIPRARDRFIASNSLTAAFDTQGVNFFCRCSRKLATVYVHSKPATNFSGAST